MKVALFKSVGSDYESVNGEGLESVGGYVRTSEYIEVNFVPLEHSSVAAKEVAELETKKDQVQAEAGIRVAEIDRRIGELLALPQSDSESEIVAPEQITTKVSKIGGGE